MTENQNAVFQELERFGGLIREQKEQLFAEIAKLHQRHELAGQVGPDYFEPGMMEFLECSDGVYDEKTGELSIRFQVAGTGFEGRTEVIEHVNTGDMIKVVRDSGNRYNFNNFTLTTADGLNVGHVPAVLCNALAPLYDAGVLTDIQASASYVEHISVRNRHARRAILFVELSGRVG